MAPTNPIRWGILATGLIASDFTNALTVLPAEKHQVVAVGARTLSSAEAFAKKFNIPKAYGSYKELADDPDIDIVYVATIHPHHFDMCKMLIEAGKNVMCEKPLTMNLPQAQRIIALAKERNVFFMEGLWSRFFPMYHKLREVIKAGDIGDIRMVQVNFGFNLILFQGENSMKKEWGGGATLILGCYALQFPLLVLGGKPEKIVATGVVKNGVDIATCVTLLYSEDRVAQINVRMDVGLDQTATIFGTKGMITMPYFWTPDKLITPEITYHEELPPKPVKPMNFPRTEGFIYEVEAVRNSLLKGEKENPVVKHKDSLDIMEILDEIRRQLGVFYDADNQ